MPAVIDASRPSTVLLILWSLGRWWVSQHSHVAIERSVLKRQQLFSLASCYRPIRRFDVCHMAGNSLVSVGSRCRLFLSRDVKGVQRSYHHDQQLTGEEAKDVFSKFCRWRSGYVRFQPARPFF